MGAQIAVLENGEIRVVSSCADNIQAIKTTIATMQNVMGRKTFLVKTTRYARNPFFGFTRAVDVMQQASLRTTSAC